MLCRCWQIIHCRAAGSGTTTGRRTSRQTFANRSRSLCVKGHSGVCSRWFHNELRLCKATVRGIVFFEFGLSHGRVAFFLWQRRKADWRRTSPTMDSRFARGTASVSNGLSRRWPFYCVPWKGKGQCCSSCVPICRFALSNGGLFV